MYYAHFGLKQPPFKITPNTDFFFAGGNRGAVLDALVYAISNGEGIIKVVGEVGSGKTMLCRMLQNILPDSIESIYLANPSVAPEHVLHAIAFELQLELPKEADRLKVMQTLQAHLLSRHAEGRQVVIFVEEAQGMPLATLEEIRLLSNLETKQDKLLQIVLFGQPELDESLNQEQIRQLRERITYRFNLSPLQTKDVGEYLIFRLRAAGYHGPHLFTEAAIKKLSHAAQGLVRRVNILADKALLAAYADNVYQVTPKHVHAAVQDSEFAERLYGQPLVRYKQFFIWIGILVLLSGLVVASVMWQRLSVQKSPAKLPASLVVQPTPVTINKPVISVANGHQGVVGQRLDAMKNLLQNAKPETVLLQIKSLPILVSAAEPLEDAALVAELESLGRQVEVDNLYLYRMRKADGLYAVVLYGAYAGRTEALDALKSLPVDIKNNRPYLRTLAGISKEVVPALTR